MSSRPASAAERCDIVGIIADYRACMGIDWMNRDELSQAIPPGRLSCLWWICQPEVLL